MRNLSEGGAALDVETPVGIPELFELVLKTEPTVWRCRVVWRKEKRIGVSFEQALPHSALQPLHSLDHD